MAKLGLEPGLLTASHLCSPVYNQSACDFGAAQAQSYIRSLRTVDGELFVASSVGVVSGFLLEYLIQFSYSPSSLSLLT